MAPSAGFMGPWFGVSAATGAALPRLPLADDAVLAIEPDGAGGYFVGGRFTRIGGVARTGLAHVLADGSIDAGFVPDLRPYSYTLNGRPGPEVRSLARSGTRLFVGGGFVTPARQVIPDGDSVYFVGNSFSLNGASWWHLAAIVRETGAVSPWNPSAIFPIGPPEGMPIGTRAARMGRTMYVHYSWSNHTS